MRQPNDFNSNNNYQLYPWRIIGTIIMIYLLIGLTLMFIAYML